MCWGAAFSLPQVGGAAGRNELTAVTCGQETKNNSPCTLYQSVERAHRLVQGKARTSSDANIFH